MLAAVALLPASAHGAADGTVTDLTWGTSRGEQDQSAAVLQEMGAGWARLGISWSDWVQPSRGTYSNTALSHFDRGVDLARATGARVMITVEESPSWARDSSSKNAPPRDNADLANFMAFLANRYEGRVEAYQVWNEPNLEWAWPHGPNAAEYADMLRDVAPAIRAADPTAKVLFAGLNRNDYYFLERAYAAVPNLGDYFDVMAVHPYVDGGRSPEAVWYDGNGRIARGAFSAYREVRRTMEARGDVKPIWFTEFGWSTTTGPLGVSQATQAEYLTRAYQCLANDPYVQVALWYSLRNEFWANDADTWVTQLGLVTTDYTRKPAFYAMRDHEGAAGTCTYQDAPPPPPGEEATGSGSTPPTPSIPPLPAPLPAPTPATGTAPANGQLPVPVAPRRLAMLAVSRAQVRDGELAVNARVVRGATGAVYGIASYDGEAHRFVAPVDHRGRIRVREELPGGTDAPGAWIALAYTGDARFHRQWVVLHAGPRSARLRLERDADASGLASRRIVTGTLNPEARGSVVLSVVYATADGELRTKTLRARIRSGGFRRDLRLPYDAGAAIVQVVFTGDEARGIGGSSSMLVVR